VQVEKSLRPRKRGCLDEKNKEGEEREEEVKEEEEEEEKKRKRRNRRRRSRRSRRARSNKKGYQHHEGQVHETLEIRLSVGFLLLFLPQNVEIVLSRLSTMSI
jgi:actin-related protein